MTPTTKSASFQQLVWDYEDNYRDLMNCDPSENEDALIKFIEIQAEGERLHKRARRHGFSWEDVEDAAAV